MIIHVYHHFPDDPCLDELPWWVDEILSKLDLISEQEQTEMASLDEITAQVAANGTVIDSAVVLINGIADRIAAAGADPVALAALVADLRAKDAVLSAAVAANVVPVPPPPAA